MMGGGGGAPERNAVEQRTNYLKYNGYVTDSSPPRMIY
jgi:hypothetical protein